MQTRSESTSILVVEDDAILGQVLARVLTRDGQIALHVPSASAALQFVSKQWRRLVLLEAGLRDGTAFSLAGAIREVCAWIPIVLLTAYRLQRSALPSWLDHQVTKSTDLRDLRRTIETALVAGQASGLSTTHNPFEPAFQKNSTRPREAAMAANR